MFTVPNPDRVSEGGDSLNDSLVTAYRVSEGQAEEVGVGAGHRGGEELGPGPGDGHQPQSDLLGGDGDGRDGRSHNQQSLKVLFLET